MRITIDSFAVDIQLDGDQWHWEVLANDKEFLAEGLEGSEAEAEDRAVETAKRIIRDIY